MTKRAIGRPWTAQEDELLANAVSIHGQVDNWKAVALSVPGRTNKACRKRWLHSLSPNVKKTAWTAEEDSLLLDLYKIHAAKWAVIARNIPGRTDDACSKRYREALDPSLKKDDWTPDEDEKLLTAYNRLGGQWGRVGQELQRSGLGCRNRWRLLERKRQTDLALVWPSSLPMVNYWHHSPSLATAPAPVDYFHHYSSSLSSALAPFEKDADSNRPPPDNAPAAVFPSSFDYESSSSACALSVGSTSPAPHTEDMHQRNVYSDCPHQFHQLQRSVSHTAIPAHTSSVLPVQVDHYAASVPHEDRSLSHTTLTPRNQPTPQTSSLRSVDAYFAASQASHMSSSMTSVSLLANPDTYYHVSPKPGLDVNAQHAHALLHTPDPLSLSEQRSAYHYAHHRDSRARVVESMHVQEQHAKYHHNHVQPGHCHHPRQPSRPLTSSPPPSRYPLQEPEPRNVHTSPQPEAGPSRATPDHYYSSNPLLSSQLVRRSTASPHSVGMPYPKRPSLDNPEDYHSPSFHPIPRRKIGTTASGKRSDSQAPLRLSSDLQATPDPDIKPYACGHENCWPSNVASSRACYCTSRGLSDHNKTVHPEDSGGDRPYRCGLEGCGKSWKSINGLQYHLQISKAHFQHAITSSYVSSYINDLALPASVEPSKWTEGEDRTKKQYKCPHQNCPNRYKQLSGLRYHLAHGHPVDLPKQLDLVPPALSRKLAEKMRNQGSASSSSSSLSSSSSSSLEHQVHHNSSSSTQDSFNL